MTKLSVNINKIAVVRNSRGGNLPDVVRAALDCERFGAQGITVHPRPDARHIRYSDVRDLKKVLTTEFNIEGNPIPSVPRTGARSASGASDARARCRERHHLQCRMEYGEVPRFSAGGDR